MVGVILWKEVKSLVRLDKFILVASMREETLSIRCSSWVNTVPEGETVISRMILTCPELVEGVAGC